MLEQAGSAARVLQVGLVLAVALLIHDLAEAFGATSCSVSSVQDCYPWGREGPSGDFWHYASREAYLASGLAGVVVLLLAFVVPFFVRAGGIGLAAMIGVLLAGFLSLRTVVTAFLPMP